MEQFAAILYEVILAGYSISERGRAVRKLSAIEILSSQHLVPVSVFIFSLPSILFHSPLPLSLAHLVLGQLGDEREGGG